MRSFLLLLGVPDMPMVSLILLAVMAALAVLMFGWLADTLLADGAFGITLNTILLAIGAAVAAVLWRRYGVPVTGLNPHAAAGLAAMSGGIGFLIAVMIVRRRF